MNQTLFDEFITLEFELDHFVTEPRIILNQTEEEAEIQFENERTVRYRLNPLFTENLQVHTTCPVCVVEKEEEGRFAYEVLVKEKKYLFVLTYDCTDNSYITYYERFAYNDTWEGFVPPNIKPFIHSIEEQVVAVLKELPQHRLYAVTGELEIRSI